MSSASVIEFGAFNPRRNLPPAVARKRREANYVAAFQRQYAAERGRRGIGGREFELAGYGIADFVWMDYGNAPRSKNKREEPVLTAFEMKLKDWRRAFSQAYRYSYFADRAIVVLPAAVASRAQEQIGVFRQFGIGLWSYDPKSARIDKRYTPSRTSARNPAAREKALARISRKVELRQGRK